MIGQKHSKETRQKIGAARAKAWARLSPEERYAMTVAIKRGEQMRRIKQGTLPSGARLGNVFIDPDFDEGL